MKYEDDYADSLSDIGFFTAALLICAVFVAVMYWVVPGFARWLAS